MALSPMYPAINGSLPALLTANITASDTSFNVSDGSLLPAAPNLLTISMDDNAEVVLYNEKNGNALSQVTRGYGGTTAQAWGQDTTCYRAYTAVDHTAFIDNINALESKPSSTTFDSVLAALPTQSLSHASITEGSTILITPVKTASAATIAMFGAARFASNNQTAGSLTVNILGDMPSGSIPVSVTVIG